MSAKREKIIDTIHVELEDDPSLAPHLLSLISSFITKGIEKKQKELNLEARLAIEMAIVSIRDRTLPASSCKAVLKQMFKAYGPPVEGDCEAVKKSWAYLQEEEN